VDPPLLLGTASHPTLNIVYAGLTGAEEVGVFTYDETGRTTFVDAVPDAGRAACWCVVSADGKHLYVATTGSNSIGVFSLDDPLHPVQIQELTLSSLRNEEHPTADFQIALDPSGRSLYVVNQSRNPTGTDHGGNQLHVLSVASDGTVSEPISPIVFAPSDVPANAHPQGVAAVVTADSSGPGAGSAPDLGGPLAGIVHTLEIGRNGPLVLPSSSTSAVVQPNQEAAGALPVMLHPQETVANPEPAQSGAGQGLHSTDSQAARLDAFFEANAVGALSLSGT
jgi:DNA-binding beta-propeller fold protein YncE